MKCADNYILIEEHGASVGPGAGASVGSGPGASVGSGPGASVGAATGLSVGSGPGASVGSGAGGSVGALVGGSVGSRPIPKPRDRILASDGAVSIALNNAKLIEIFMVTFLCFRVSSMA